MAHKLYIMRQQNYRKKLTRFFMSRTEITVIPLLNKEVGTEALLRQRHTKEYYDAAAVKDTYL